MRIAAVIPTFNRVDLLRTSIGQLQEQATALPDLDLTIIVVNDGCTDSTETMLAQELPEVVQVKTPGNYWYTKSMNVGFEEAMKLDVDYVLTLNDDIELKPDYLQKITEAVAKYDAPIIMGSTSITVEQPPRVTFSGVKEIKWWRFKQTTFHDYLQEVPESSLKGEKESALLPGRGMLIDARILRKIGLFEPRLAQYASDDEFCYRAIRSNFKVYVSWDAIIYSHHELTGDGTPQLKQSLFKFTKSFFNQYSRNYWRKHFFIVWNYGIKLLFPITISIVFLGEFYSYFKYRLK